MENKDDSNVVEKAGEEIKQTEQAVDSASKLAANMASGNVAGAIKEGINLAKNKQVRRRMKIQMIMQLSAILLVLSIIISIVATLFSIFKSVAKKMGNLVNVATEYNTNMWKYLTNDYWIDLSKEIEVEYIDESGNTRKETRTVVEQYMYELDTLGISLKELNLLGEADYSDPDLLKDPKNKAIVEKYIKSFVVADLISSQIHRRRTTVGELVFSSSPMYRELEEETSILLDSALGDTAILSDKVDGGVFLYRAESTTRETGNAEKIYDLGQEKKYAMEYTEYETFQKRIDEYNSIDDNVKKDKDVESIFAVNSDGDLVFARVEGKVTETEEEGDVHSRKIENEKKAIIEVVDYKHAIAEYSLPYEFLVELCMVTQNPEYVFHVAQLALSTKIDLIITDNKEVTIRNKKTTKEYTKDDGTKGRKTIWTTTTKETTTPELLVKTINSWNVYKNNTCNFIVTEETNGEDNDKTTKIKNEYSLLQGKVVRKSDNFLGLLRNSFGLYIVGTTPYFLIPGTTFDRNGTNVRYVLPNRSKSADPLSMLESGEQELYALMEQDAEKQDNEKTDENEDIIQINNSDSIIEKKQSRTAPLVEIIKYFLTYPEQEYGYIEEEIRKFLGLDSDDLLDEEIENINTTEKQQASAKEIYDFFIEKGFTPEAACGILGNIQQESSFNLTATNGSHWGLCQWGGGRFKNLAALAHKKGKTWAHLDIQLEFIWQEFCGSEKATKDALINCDDLLEATSSFCKLYERCGNYSTEVQKRYKYAKYWYNKLVEKTETDVDSTSNYDGIYTSKSKKKYKLYRQNYYRNTQYGKGTIASQGCSITAVATTLSAYGSNKSPAQLIGGGSSSLVSIDGLLKQNGLNVTRIYGFKNNTIQTIEENLEKGRPVVFNVNSNSSYTSNEHWMTLADIRTNNDVTEVYVLNPNKNGKEGWNKITNVINKSSLKSYIIVNE